MLKSSNKKAFVLPSTIISIVVVTMLSILVFSMVLMTTTQNKIFARETESKILDEAIFYNFKNSGSLDFENVDIQVYVSTTDENVKAVLATKNEQAICFGVYNFSTQQTICYQNDSFAYTIQEDEKLVFESLIFTKL